MASLADCLLKLRNSLRSGEAETQALAGRLTPVVLLEDFTRQFDATQGQVRPWAAGADLGVGGTDTGQVQVQVPLASTVISEIVAIHVSAQNNSVFEMQLRANGTAPLGAPALSQFRDRRGVVRTSTGTETTTVVSTAIAAIVVDTPMMSWRIGTESLVLPIGMVLGPDDVVLFINTNLASDLVMTVLGIERPLDR